VRPRHQQRVPEATRRHQRHGSEHCLFAQGRRGYDVTESESAWTALPKPRRSTAGQSSWIRDRTHSSSKPRPAADRTVVRPRGGRQGSSGAHQYDSNRCRRPFNGRESGRDDGPSDFSSSGRATQQAAGLWVGGLGVAAVAAGSVFGVIAKLKWSASRTDCETSFELRQLQPSDRRAQCGGDGRRCLDGHLHRRWAAVITGALLLLTLPHEAPASGITGARLQLTPSVGPGNVALSLDGVFR